MTHLAVPITASDPAAADGAIGLARLGGAELIELRLDLLPEASGPTLTQSAGRPVLATCRAAEEGGGRETPDAARAGALVAAAAAGAGYIDFELAAWNRSPDARAIIAKARAAGAKLILSAHDFAGMPADLRDRMESLWRSPADVAKIACTAVRITDALRVLDLLHDAPKPTVALAMGEAGVITRLLARKLGAFCTFAALDAGQGTAPGQPTLAELRGLYRWVRVGPATRLFGVAGYPVGHSMSPAIHNAAFDATGIDGLYVPLLVEPSAEAFDAFMDGVIERNGWLNFLGLSVTIPHKENALRYVLAAGGKVDGLSERIGAINTIHFEADGSLSGCNTDYAAAIDAVCDGLDCTRAGLARREALVLGAGGVARAIVAGFVDAGSRVTIVNRTADRAQKLAAEFGCRAGPLDERGRIDAEVVINATSIGMHPRTSDSPLPPEAIRPGMLVFDTVYNPVRTKLLADAEAAGARTVSGVEMFVRQAAAQFEFWTGQAAPADVMRAIVLRCLVAKE
ncbi:MAG: Shikimate dehydrogenase (NADP(+)) [Phycisphaerae bacterium]|nr:Shikimate dehydrogenase (NADP(+)) [Phycisphaerae bacterium]